MVTREAEQIILGAWLSGQHTEDVNLFSPDDFQYLNGIATAYMRGITGHYQIVKASKARPDEVASLLSYYTESLYEGVMKEVADQKARQWIAEHPDATATEIADSMQVYKRETVSIPQPPKDLVFALQDEFDLRQTTPVVATGLTALDNMLNGIRRKELTSIGARPSVGKSAFVQQVAMEVAKHGHKVLFFPLEMSAIAVTERMFMRYTNFPQYVVRKGLTEKQWEDPQTEFAFQKMNDLLKSGNLLIFERCNDLQVIQELIKFHKPYMIVIDQLEQLKDGKRSWQDKRSRFSHMTHELQGIAMDLDVAVWLACQVNRSADNAMPTMANLKESGSIEEDSDNVILLHRESEEKTEVQRILLDLAKQRNGECGTVPLGFRASKYTFYGIEG